MCPSCAVAAAAADGLFVVVFFSFNTHRFYHKSRVICSIWDQNLCCLTLPYSAQPYPAARVGQQGEGGEGAAASPTAQIMNILIMHCVSLHGLNGRRLNEDSIALWSLENLALQSWCINRWDMDTKHSMR